MIPSPRLEKARAAAYDSLVKAVTFRAIIFSITLMSDVRSGVAAPMPALFTSIVMLASIFKIDCIFATSSEIVSSAAMISIERPVSVVRSPP
jgi:hypothetical protein